jgi:hypothetical protein
MSPMSDSIEFVAKIADFLSSFFCPPGKPFNVGKAVITVKIDDGTVHDITICGIVHAHQIYSAKLACEEWLDRCKYRGVITINRNSYYAYSKVKSITIMYEDYVIFD